MGSSLGVSAFGALLNAQLASHFPGMGAGGRGGGHFDLSSLRRLPPAFHAQAVDAFSSALHTVFTVASGVLALAFLLALALREAPPATASPRA